MIVTLTGPRDIKEMQERHKEYQNDERRQTIIFNLGIVEKRDDESAAYYITTEDGTIYECGQLEAERLAAVVLDEMNQLMNPDKTVPWEVAE